MAESEETRNSKRQEESSAGKAEREKLWRGSKLDFPRDGKSSIVSEIVVNMTILMLAAVVLITIFINWTYGFLSIEYAINYAPYILVPYILFFGLTVAIYGWRLISRVIVRPIRTLLEATHKVAEGDFSFRVEVESGDELGQLSDAFNIMTERLEQNNWELLSSLQEMRRLNENLARTQRELLSSEKLASVGRLAAGVAHEIGNPLAAISGYLDLLRRRDYIEDKDGEMIGRIQAEVKRINEIIRELLDYSRPQDESVTPIDLNECVRSTLTLMSAQKGIEKVKVETRLGEVPVLRANRSKTQQLIMNLAMNAVHAMPGGGNLTITTRPADMAGRPGMELIVEDTGEGIDPDNLERIFDPFFTTKEPGKGTGLGLSICLRIVENMKGKIIVTSRPGAGAVFTTWLPAAGDREDPPLTSEHGEAQV